MPEGVVHIQSTFNNTIITITDPHGQRARRGRAPARSGFKGSRKATPFAAQVAAEDAAQQGDGARHAQRAGVREGPGRGPRVGAARAAGGGLQGHADQGRDADPAQRLPPAEAAARLRTRSYAWLVTPDAVCRLCRREGLKLFLKGDRCYTDKCAIERRTTRPASTARARAKFSEYGVQLREKQKVQAHVRRAREAVPPLLRRGRPRAKGVTGENLLQLLERRLDNVVYRLGFATSRAEARQLVRHGHFQ